MSILNNKHLKIIFIIIYRLFNNLWIIQYLKKKSFLLDLK